MPVRHCQPLRSLPFSGVLIVLFAIAGNCKKRKIAGEGLDALRPSRAMGSTILNRPIATAHAQKVSKCQHRGASPCARQYQELPSSPEIVEAVANVRFCKVVRPIARGEIHHFSSPRAPCTRAKR